MEINVFGVRKVLILMELKVLEVMKFLILMEIEVFGVRNLIGGLDLASLMPAERYPASPTSGNLITTGQWRICGENEIFDKRKNRWIFFANV